LEIGERKRERTQGLKKALLEILGGHSSCVLGNRIRQRRVPGVMYDGVYVVKELEKSIGWVGEPNGRGGGDASSHCG